MESGLLLTSLDSPFFESGRFLHRSSFLSCKVRPSSNLVEARSFSWKCNKSRKTLRPMPVYSLSGKRKENIDKADSLSSKIPLEGGRKQIKATSSKEVMGMLNSISDPDCAFEIFKSVGKMPNVVHTTETCNYMLEVLRVEGRIGDMAFVFDLMQKQIINRNLTTYLTIFKALDVKGGIRQAPIGLERMRSNGLVMNSYSYNGLIHLLIQSGFFKEALEDDLSNDDLFFHGRSFIRILKLLQRKCLQLYDFV